MSSVNSCQDFFSGLKIVCRNVDTKVADLEMLTQGAGLGGRFAIFLVMNMYCFIILQVTGL